MVWPTTPIPTANLDAGTDSPATARANLLQLAQQVNQLQAHVSAFAATLLDDADAAAARATLDVPSRSGANASGTWGISVSGNAATATSAGSVTGSTTAAVPTSALGSGTASSATFLRGDRTFAAAGLSAASTAQAQAGTADTVAITPLKLREGLNASGSAPVYACRAWVNFNGTGTVAIRGSGNVSSITDLGVGNYIVNFSGLGMPDDAFAFVGTARSTTDTASSSLVTVGPRLSSQRSNTDVGIVTQIAGAAVDSSEVCVAIFR